MEKTILKEEKSTTLFKIALNGGNRVLSCATISVAWKLSQELIGKKPQYVVLCDHPIGFSKFQKDEHYSLGKRYILKVSDLQKFLQFRKPGVHHLVCIIFCGEEHKAAEKAWGYMRTEVSSDEYKKPIRWKEIERGELSETEYNGYITAIELELPRELFSYPPERGLGKIFWKWANYGFKTPRDDCKFRGRAFFAVTAKPFLVLPYRIIIGVVSMAYVLIGGILIFLFGFRPTFEHFFHGWLRRNEFDLDLYYFSEEIPYRGSGWQICRRWDKDSRRKFSAWLVPILIPVEIAVVSAIVFGALYLHKILSGISVTAVGGTSSLFTIIMVVGITFAIATTIAVKIYTSDKYQTRRSLKREKKLIKKSELEIREVEEKKASEQAYGNFLKKAALLSESNSDTIPVDLEIIRDSVSNTEKLRISFWATKAKICKPYAQE